MVPASLQDVEEPQDVALDVGVRVAQGVANACLGRKVHHGIEGSGIEKGFDGSAFAKTDGFELEVGEALKPGQAVFLQLHVIIWVEVVQADHLPSSLQELQGEVHPDEAGGAGDQYWTTVTHQIPLNGSNE
jgi:hypothetical protein